MGPIKTLLTVVLKKIARFQIRKKSHKILKNVVILNNQIQARQWVIEVEDKFKEDVILDLKSKNLFVKEVLGRIVAKETDLHLRLHMLKFLCFKYN